MYHIVGWSLVVYDPFGDLQSKLCIQKMTGIFFRAAFNLNEGMMCVFPVSERRGNVHGARRQISVVYE